MVSLMVVGSVVGKEVGLFDDGSDGLKKLVFFLSSSLKHKCLNIFYSFVMNSKTIDEAYYT